MGVCGLCSFHDNTPCNQNKMLTSVVNVMLGCSEVVEDVEAALRHGPVRFLSYLGGIELPCAIARAICSRADDMHTTFSVSSTEITDLVKHYLEHTFRTSSTSGIGARETYNFQRLVYNVSARVVSFYDSELTHCKRGKEECVSALRRGTELVAIFADAIKRWMPVSPWFDGWWTKWHVLAYVLEMTSGTVLSEGNQKWYRPSFLVFCDTIAGHALEERDRMSTSCITDYKSSSFAWIACSKAWNSVLASCHGTKTSMWTLNSRTFLTVTEEMFNNPMASFDTPTRPSSPKYAEAPVRSNEKKRHYVSPESERKVASRVGSSCGGGGVCARAIAL